MLYIFSLYFYHTAHSQSLLSSPTRRSSDLQYGLNYGRGVKAIAEELGLTIEDTEGLIQGIFDTYPGLKEWQDKVKRAVVDPSLSYMLTTPFNIRFQSEVVTSRYRNAVENTAMELFLQSTAISEDVRVRLLERCKMK